MYPKIYPKGEYVKYKPGSILRTKIKNSIVALDCKIFICVKIIPLGVDVDPELYMTTNASSNSKLGTV